MPIEAQCQSIYKMHLNLFAAHTDRVAAHAHTTCTVILTHKGTSTCTMSYHHLVSSVVSTNAHYHIHCTLSSQVREIFFCLNAKAAQKTGQSFAGLAVFLSLVPTNRASAGMCAVHGWVFLSNSLLKLTCKPREERERERSFKVFVKKVRNEQINKVRGRVSCT